MGNPVILWILFLLVNGAGGQAEGYSTEQECLDARKEAIQVPTTLMASDCARVIIHPLRTAPGKSDVGGKK